MAEKYVFETFDTLRLDLFLRSELPSAVNHLEKTIDFSNSKLRRLILSGSVRVNEKVCRRPAFELRGHSVISVLFDREKFLYEKQPDDVSFELTEKDVLFEDDYLIFVNKPVRFPTEETIVGGEKRDNLHSAVVRYLWNKNQSLRNPPYVGIMHRLDRETSGVILFTKQRCVNKAIQKIFEEHNLKKIYLALVVPTGALSGYVHRKTKSLKEGSSFTVEKYINRINSKTHEAKWGSVSQSRGGFYSKTDFTVLEKRKFSSRDAYMLQANLFTGRTHQIRVHLSEEGLPIVGDVLYGGIPAERVMLHAHLLELYHPITNEVLIISAPCPF